MYISEFNNVLFKRVIKEAVRSDIEDEMRAAVFLVVTKESNGYAVWYSSSKARIVAFCNDRDAAIKYAAGIDRETAEEYADESSCNYNLPQGHLPEIREAKV